MLCCIHVTFVIGNSRAMMESQSSSTMAQDRDYGVESIASTTPTDHMGSLHLSTAAITSPVISELARDSPQAPPCPSPDLDHDPGDASEMSSLSGDSEPELRPHHWPLTMAGYLRQRLSSSCSERMSTNSMPATDLLSDLSPRSMSYATLSDPEYSDGQQHARYDSVGSEQDGTSCNNNIHASGDLVFPRLQLGGGSSVPSGIRSHTSHSPSVLHDAQGMTLASHNGPLRLAIVNGSDALRKAIMKSFTLPQASCERGRAIMRSAVLIPNRSLSSSSIASHDSRASSSSSFLASRPGEVVHWRQLVALTDGEAAARLVHVLEHRFEETQRLLRDDIPSSHEPLLSRILESTQEVSEVDACLLILGVAF